MSVPMILIIEDNPVSSKALRLTLESEHYTVVEAADAASALKKASTQFFDLIIQNLILHDMDWLTLNQKLRALPHVQLIPIFALSGFLVELDPQSKLTGFTIFLLKPIEPSYLLDLVKVHLAVSRSLIQYRTLVDISPNAIFIKQNKMLVYANRAALKLLGVKKIEDLLTLSFDDFFLIDSQKIIEQYTEKNKNSDAMLPIEGKIKNFKGDILDVEMVGAPFSYQDQSATYIILWDVTERKRSALHLEIQYSIASTLAEAVTLFVATGKILKIICERLQWDCGVIWAVDKKNNVLRCTRTWQMPQIQDDVFQQTCMNMSFSLGADSPGKVWKNRKALWKTNILHDESFLRHEFITQIGLNTTIAFPILYEDKILGVIEFFSKNTFQVNRDFLLWFESIGIQFGVFLKRKHIEEQMSYLTEHDALTGLSNRLIFERFLEGALASAKKSKEKLAILFLDLDNFKYVNDSMGHQAGDLLLKEVSQRLSSCIRKQDLVSRLGGDEFIILLSNVGSKKVIVEIINALQIQLSSQRMMKEAGFFMTASIGISRFPEDGNTVSSLIKSADIAMYAAKEKGRNTFQFCTPEMTVKAENRGVLLNNLRNALENNEFILYYQPKIETISQRVVGMEALIRWKRPDAVILPNGFIDAAEDSDLIIPICEWVLKTACLQNKAWQMMGLPTINVSINLSVRNLNKRLLQVMEAVLSETNIHPYSFEIELTESALMYNPENNIQILRSLKEMGLKISIDDFGTGYSSLSYLKLFPIDIIKIDRSFVSHITTDPKDAAIVIAIIAMARSLRYQVIAEGVETKAQLKFLKKYGCDQIQGYYFSRPLPVAEATEFIKKSYIQRSKHPSRDR
ncbi:MAG: EAL domain-containing protein [Gammaproteobacteria bacterium]|nr:EAL domain-containing protein [Gammaproteobacteria bacterium]